MNNVLLWVGGLLVAVLALLFAAPHAIDWNSYRGVFEEEASRLLGRDVRVGGRVDLRLLPKPYVKFEKIRIGDVGPMQGEPFFRAESFTLWLSIPPLLRGELEAHDVELDRPTLSLAMDERGEGNWRSLQISAGSLPFLPSDVTLQSVRISDGSLLLRDTLSRSSIALTGIDGELAATALTGPYRFRGEVNANGDRHEVRLGTGTPEADGKVRLKLTVRSAASHSSYTVDGALADLTGRPRLEGALTAKLPVAPTAGAPGQPVVFDLQALLAADSGGAKLSDLALGFEQDGRPQLLTGSMTAAWGASRSLSFALTSRWLDLDRIAQSTDNPLDAARDLAARMAFLLPSDGTSRASIEIDQVNLGGEALSDVVLKLVRRGEALELEELSGLVPGNGRLSVQGSFSAAGGANSVFSGPLVARGASLQRFLGWAFPGRGIVTGFKSEVPFTLSGTLSLAEDGAGLGGATLELPGSRLTGGIEHRKGAAPELAIRLEGDTVDLSILSPEVARLEDWRQFAGLGDAAGSDGRVLARLARDGLVKLDIRARRLMDGEATVHDVVAELSAGRNRVDIKALRVKTDEGLALELSGAIGGTAGRADGRFTGWVSAPGAPAAQQLWRQFALLAPGAGPVLPEEASALAPLEFGFAAQLPIGAATPATFKADGMIAGSSVVADGTLAGGVKDWRNARIEIGASVESDDLPAFIGRLNRRDVGTERSGSQNIGGSATIKVSGANAEGLSAIVDIKGRDLTASFDGKLRLVDDRVDADGELKLNARDTGPLLGMLEPKARMLSRPLAAEGIVGLNRSGGVIRLSPRRLDLAGARIAGEITLTREKAATRVAGRIAAARGSLVDLLGAVLDGRARGGNPDLAGLPSVWPEGPFDFSGTDGVEGRLALAFASLDVGEGLELSDAALDLELSPGRISVPRIEGRALGGGYSGRIMIERAAGGASVSVAGQLQSIAVAQAMGAAGAGGSASLSFEASGRAASLRGIVSALSGRGRIVLSDAKIAGLSPTAVDAAADALLEAPATISRVDLVAVVRKALAGSTLVVGGRELAVEISEGSARIAPLEVKGSVGVARNTSTLDLLTLKLDSEWTLTSTRRKSAMGGELPSIAVVHVGPLKDVTRIEPKVSVEALERELTVRRMERDVDRLESLRRQDEQRARAMPPDAAGSPSGGDQVIEAPLPIPPAVPAKRPDTAAPTRPGSVNRVPRTEARPRTLEEVLRE